MNPPEPAAEPPPQRPRQVLERLREGARRVRRELAVAYFAARDPRTPWFVRMLALAVAAYALSPIDLIPDFVPLLGYLDDLVIVPLGLWLVIRLLPPEVLEAARLRAAQAGRLPVSRAAAAMIVAAWIAGVALAAIWWWNR